MTDKQLETNNHISYAMNELETDNNTGITPSTSESDSHSVLEDTQIPPASTHILNQHGYSSALELIGEGSNGKTYKTKDLKTGQMVAVKELKFSENLKNYELFEREAETLKSIHTPGTPVFYEYITNQKEFTECWLVQEYIDGESILDKLERVEQYDELKTLNLLLQVADIIRMLQTLYAPAIIHRDIKPSNILIRNRPKDGMDVCLIDFGAVANPQRRGLNSTVAGTVGYMAPEQLIGDCTIQSDYYALGATALHMLSGIAPSAFPADGFTLNFKEKLQKHCPSIHKETIELLEKLLAPHPEDRPQNAHELIALITKTLKNIQHENAETDSQNRLPQKFLHFASFLFRHSLLILLPVLCIIIFYIYEFHPELFLQFIDALLSSKLGFLLILAFQSFLFYGVPAIVILLFIKIYKKFSERSDSSKEEVTDTLYSVSMQPELQNPEEVTDTLYSVSMQPELQNPIDSSNKEVTATIAALFVNIVEYTYTLDHKSYTAFHTLTQEQMENHHYKEGDTFKLLYNENGYFHPQI